MFSFGSGMMCSTVIICVVLSTPLALPHSLRMHLSSRVIYVGEVSGQSWVDEAASGGDTYTQARGEDGGGLICIDFQSYVHQDMPWG